MSTSTFVPLTLGDVRPISSFVSADSGGSFVQLDRPGHGCAALIVWRLDGEERSPQQEAFAKFIIDACGAHDDLVAELLRAEKIILAMLNSMTLKQKTAVDEKLTVAGISPAGMTRYHERRAALSKAGVA